MNKNVIEYGVGFIVVAITLIIYNLVSYGNLDRLDYKILAAALIIGILFYI